MNKPNWSYPGGASFRDKQTNKQGKTVIPLEILSFNHSYLLEVIYSHFPFLLPVQVILSGYFEAV